MILDSNIIIYYAFPENKDIRNFLKKNENILSVSAISKVEVLGYNKLSTDEQNAFEHFFQNINILSIDSTVIEKAISIRQFLKISLGDSIIAATALVHNKKLFTNNENDFKHIPELEIISINSIKK